MVSILRQHRIVFELGYEAGSVPSSPQEIDITFQCKLAFNLEIYAVQFLMLPSDHQITSFSPFIMFLPHCTLAITII